MGILMTKSCQTSPPFKTCLQYMKSSTYHHITHHMIHCHHWQAQRIVVALISMTCYHRMLLFKPNFSTHFNASPLELNAHHVFLLPQENHINSVSYHLRNLAWRGKYL